MKKYKFIEKNNMAAFVKLISVFICYIIVITIINREMDMHDTISMLKTISIKNFSIFTIGIICMGILIILYEIWLFSVKRDTISGCNITEKTIEIVIYLIFFSLLVFYSGGHESKFKFIFLLIIITSGVQRGLKAGIATASFSSLFILSLDLFSRPLNMVNCYFQADLVLAGLFMITAWFLGYYNRTEKEYKVKLDRYENIDELTESFDNKSFYDILTDALIKVIEYNSTLSIMFIDIDYFKQYNDLYGRIEGNKVLRRIKAILKENIRIGDIISKYGGIKFAVILFNTSLREAGEIGERIRNSIKNIHFNGAESQPGGKITVSIGITNYPERAKNELELLNYADKALRKAKSLRENIIKIY